MWIGAIVTHGLQALFFPLTFIDHKIIDFIYAGSWAILGIVPAILLFINVNAFFLAAVDTYELHSDIDSEEIEYTILAYILSEFALGVLTKTFLWDSVMYMLSEDVKDWCESRAEFCTDYGVLNKNKLAQ